MTDNTNVHEALETYLERFQNTCSTECQLTRGLLDHVLAKEGGLTRWYNEYKATRSDLEYFAWPDDALAAACRDGDLLKIA